MIDIRDTGAVRVLTVSSGKVNALDVELLTELTDAVHGAQQSESGALVVTGAGSVFSAGVDLRRVLDGGQAYTDQLVPALSAAFTALFSFPRPTVAAINGAAIAGGCVLACACDRRLLAAGATIGASELRVGVPFPVAALEILRHACGDHAEDVLLEGRLHQGSDALARGLAHALVDGDAVGPAVDVASDLATISADAYANTKAQLRGPALARIQAGASVDEGVRAAWGSKQVAEAISAQFDRLR
ncbi:MAG: enoyl-CoA hydratase/isomerase family protein, partial [Acidimicrobiaceae bacterium]|nr:enoyl-CoA hydratase/isomerase family protein [Acidimicrobiaceae bacterium]